MSARDRVTTAAEATAASVRQIRPLTLPEDSAAAAEPGGHRGGGRPQARGALTRIRETWLVPLGAAAAVAALALALVIVRGTEGPLPAPALNGTIAPPVAGIPRYYAIASEGKQSHDGQAAISVTIADVYTRKAIATVATPPVSVGGNSSVAGLSATADDRTFVVGSRNIDDGVGYYLVQVNPGPRPVAKIEQLPIPQVAVGNLLGFAVSPDGRELAVLTVRGNGTTLRVYSVESGATLRTWIAGSWRFQGNGMEQQAGVSWTADGRQVAFSTAIGGTTYSGVLEERLIAATAPSGDLAAASKVVLRAPGNCSSLLLTPDGGTVVCATLVNFPPPTSLDRRPAAPAVCGKDGPAFVAYSAVTGKRLRVLYQYAGTCDYGVETVLWADNSARHVIGEQYLSQQHQVTDRYGVAAAGQFSKFQVAQHGQWYSGPAF
jgi:hypothetical protein